MRGVSHFLSWQDYIVTYGNKRNISAFQALRSGYQLVDPHDYNDKSIASMQSTVQAIEAFLPYTQAFANHSSTLALLMRRMFTVELSIPSTIICCCR